MMQPQDVQRLIQIIVEELAAAQAAPVPARCACHSMMYECCPDRLAGVLEAGATRIGIHASGGAAGSVATMIDHTLLKPDATRKEIEALCREAAEYRFATVCVNPTWVATCARLLRASGVQCWPFGLNQPKPPSCAVSVIVFSSRTEWTSATMPLGPMPIDSTRPLNGVVEIGVAPG